MPMSDKSTRPSADEVTQLLQAIDSGDSQAAELLLPLVYQELRVLARARMRDERPGQTLTPTALVHEAYLRLVQGQSTDWANKAHFFAAAAQAMRRILIEIARRKSRVKHGGGLVKESISDMGTLALEQPQELLSLDESLTRLEASDPKMADIVKFHFFAGLTLAETADAMEVSERTVSRLWRAARAWIYEDMAADS